MRRRLRGEGWTSRRDVFTLCLHTRKGSMNNRLGPYDDEQVLHAWYKDLVTSVYVCECFIFTEL